MPYALRRPTIDDAAAVLALMTACDVAAIGHPDTTLNDVLDELREPDVDLSTDAWIAIDEAGVAMGFCFTFRQGSADIVELDLYVHPEADGLATQIWELAEARAIQIGRTLGHPQLRIDVGIYRSDERQRTIAAAHGYAAATAFYRMRIDHAGQVTAPARPGDIRIDVVGDDDLLRRAAVRIDNESFVEHFGFVEHDDDWWAAKFEHSSSISWELAKVLSVDGVPAALLLASTQYVEDENCGYIDTLGVLKEYRGRGLGRLLLLDAFAQDAALGRVGTILHVDANNVTPALGLYESVGMRQVLIIDGWRRTVDM